jgi:cytidylate kinase
MLTTAEVFTRETEAIERARRHWQTRQQAAAGAATMPAITIALAREAGAPGTSVAREIGKRLGWPVYDHEILERIAQEMGLRVNLLESIDEKRQSWILEGLEAFSEKPHVSENSYVRHLAQTVLSLGAHGECIIVGRGAAQVLPRKTTLRVRLIGEEQDRIAALSARLGISLQEAARKVAEIDRERSRFIKDHFRKDPADPHQYDLLLNISRWSVAECADQIVAALSQMKKRSGDV